MQELTDLLEATLQQTTFEKRNPKVHAPHQLLETYRTSPLVSNWSTITAKPQVPEKVFAELSEYLRKLLAQFIADDRIRSGVSWLIAH